ncbi:hypothetical protein IW147_003179 [Coemansia sp. RSA 720]|nr:hypothetical protein IW147_003179 [Coemansia sp. RSA 720]
MATWDEVATQTIPGELPTDTADDPNSTGSIEPLSPASSTQRPKRYVCVECNKAYTRPSKLDEHMRTHTGERPFACHFPGCTKRYMRNGHLQVHSSTHMPTSQHICTVPGCTKTFSTNHHLRRHMSVHDDDKPHMCTFEGCSRRFAKRSQLHVHVCSHTGENPHVCTVQGCGMSFKYPSQLKRHHRTHSEEIRYTCAHIGCMQVFAKWSQLQAHRAVHKPTAYACHVCGKEFARRHALTVHLLRHDPDRTVFACEYDECTRFYIDENALRAHVRVVHSEKPRYECPHECGKSYAYARSLRDHIKREHGDLLAKDGTNGVTVDEHKGSVERSKKRRRTREPTEIEVASGMAYENPSISGRLRACTVDKCGFRFKRQIELDTHLMAIHNIDVEADND